MRNLVIGGNWKLKINTIQQTKNVLTDIRDFVTNIDTDLEIFLALPYTTLYVGQDELKESNIGLAAQNVHYDESGPYTGEISIESLKEFNVEYILIGHSERRIIFGEKDKNLNMKIHKTLEHGLIPVFCIGETAKDRNAGKFKQVLHDQLASGLKDITEDQLQDFIIAYEPVWAINNKLLNPDSEIKAATPEEAASTHQIIRNWLKDNYNDTVAKNMRILYGGSMKPKNAEALLSKDDIDGGLIGSASLSSETLGPIIEIAKTISK